MKSKKIYNGTGHGEWTKLLIEANLPADPSLQM